MSVTCTVEDLDRELPETLLPFVLSHLELKNTLDRARDEMEEASKTARAEARKKSGSQSAKKDPVGSPGKPAATSEAPSLAKAETLKAAGLFDSAPEPVRDAPASGGTPPPCAASETGEDEKILRETCSEAADPWMKEGE